MANLDPLHRELKILRMLEPSLREQLHSVESAGMRSLAVSALAAAAAERAHSRSESLSQWRNETSDVWRMHLAAVWRYIEGDLQQHHVLSNAIAAFLTGPLNHTDGQDGPNDFDRPQTIASYSAVASVVFWGVDFATTAVGQIFELIDLAYDGNLPPERITEVERERDWALNACQTIVTAASSGPRGLHPTLLEEYRSYSTTE